MANNPLNKLYEALQMYEIQDAEKKAEIDRLTKENKELTERVRDLEEQPKDHSQGKRSKDDPIMKMYEAQAIAIEKEMEVARLIEEMDKMKEEMERLKREKEEMFELVKQLGKEQRVSATSELTSRNMELDILKGRDKEKETKIDEMKKKNEELEERLRRLEMNKEKKIDAPSSSSHNSSGNVKEIRIKVFDSIRNAERRGFKGSLRDWGITALILVPGCSPGKGKCLLVLSADRTKWIEIDLKFPDKSWHEGAVYLDEDLYIIGGDENAKALYKLDKTLKWKQLADMNIGQAWIKNSCLEWNGYIWVFGGCNDKYNNLASVERYDPKENKWTFMPDMKYPRSMSAATTWNNGIIISGGIEDSTGDGSSTVQFFNPKNGFWTELPKMPNATANHSLVSYKNKLIVMGGFNRGWLDSVWQLDPHEANPKWKPLPSMKNASDSFAGIVFDEEIYAIGGEGRGWERLDRVEIFDGKHWRDGPSLPVPMTDTSAMIIPQHYADRLCNYQPE